MQKFNAELKKAYVEALKDPDFKLVVSKLKIPDEELMKYTSDLQEATLNFKRCATCKGLHTCQNKIIGYSYLPLLVNHKLTFSYRACRYQEKHQKEDAYKKYVFTFDTPIEIQNASLSNIYKDDKKRYATIKWLTNFIKNYPNNEKGLYLHGNFGCGKTYLVAAAFNELATKKVNSAIVFWPEFLRSLKASFNTNDFDNLYERIKKVPLLLIDDIGAENTTSWSRDEIFCPLIQYRMENHLPTFFTSNLTLKELEEHFSISKNNVDNVKARRIISRIEQLTDDIEMVSANLRK
jgi:primosomal protein DnaI